MKSKCYTDREHNRSCHTYDCYDICVICGKNRTEKENANSGYPLLADVGERLLPCPFCGGSAYIKNMPHDEIDTEYWVICQSCAAEGPWSKSKNAAKTLWNKRANVS